MKEPAASTGAKESVRRERLCRYVNCLGLFLLLLLLAPCAVASPSLIGQPESSEQLEYGVVRKLIESELFELAVARCRSLIGEAPAGSIRRAKRQAWLLEATIEGDASKTVNIADAMKQAESLVEEWRSSSGPPLNQLWLEFYLALARFNIARRSLANYLAAPASTAPRDDALEAVRKTLDRSEELARALAELPAADRPSATNAETADVAGLRNRLQLLRIDAYLLRSECYPFGSDDALAAATEAMNTMRQLRSHVESDWSGKELLEIAGFRSLAAAGLDEQAVDEIEAWLKKPHEQVFRDQVIALAVDLFLRLNTPERARQWLATAESKTRSPELALAELKLKIDAWKAGRMSSADSPSVQRQLESILEIKDGMAKRFGTYWGRRAEAAVLASGNTPTIVTPNAASSSLELIKLEIRQLLAANQWKAAVERLDQAEATAAAGRQVEQAFSFAKTAIGLLQKQSPSESGAGSISLDWIRRALDRSVRYSNQPGAELLHYAAVEASAAVEPSNYESRLTEHLRTWPGADTTIIARKRLIQLSLLAGNVEERLQALLGSPDLLYADELVNLFSLVELDGYSKRYRSSIQVEDASAELRKKLNDLPFDGDPELKLARDVAMLLTADYSHWPNEASLVSQFHLAPSSGKGSGHEGPKRVSSLDDDSPDTMVKSYQQIARLLEAAVSENKVGLSEDEISSLIRWFESDTVFKIGTLLQLDFALTEILRVRKAFRRDDSSTKAWHSSAVRIHQTASSAFSSMEAAVSPAIAVTMKRSLLLAQGRLAGLAEDWETAIRDLEAKSRATPREEIRLLESARILEIQSPTEIQRALGLYRQLANGSKIGSDLWFEARLGAIRSLQRLGRNSETDELTATLKALVPTPPTKWKGRIAN